MCIFFQYFFLKKIINHNLIKLNKCTINTDGACIVFHIFSLTRPQLRKYGPKENSAFLCGYICVCLTPKYAPVVHQ